MTKLVNIPHLVIICFSFLVSSYIVGTFLLPQLGEILGYATGAVVALLTHFYLIHSIRESIKNNKLHQSLIIGFALTGAVLFMEYRGVADIAHKSIVDSTEVNELKANIREYEKQLIPISTSRKWQDIESKRVLQTNIQQSRNALGKAEKVVIEQTAKADTKAQSYRFFSVIMLVLSCVASSCIKEDSQSVSDNTITAFKQVSEEKSQSVSQTVSQSVSDKEDTPKQDLKLLSESERILLATDYIKSTNETDHRQLARMFSLSFKAVKIAKDKADIKPKQTDILTVQQKPIGF